MVGKLLKHMRMKHMRINSGYKQSEIASLIGIKPNTLSDHERDITKPSYEMVAKIADICEFDIEFIDRNSGERYTENDLEDI